MPLRDLLKKKYRAPEEEPSLQPVTAPLAPEFKFYRSDTNTQELIDETATSVPAEELEPGAHNPGRTSFGRLRSSPRREKDEGSPGKERRRFSQRLHLHRDKSRSSSTSSNVPSDLPEVPDAYTNEGDELDKQAQWEKRGISLIQHSPYNVVSVNEVTKDVSQLGLEDQRGRPRRLSDAGADIDIQKAIELHESQDESSLRHATIMFGQLADQGNVLAQLLYGLSLRHGWGCGQDPSRAFQYLQSAVTNSAAVEQAALTSGRREGGSAKGELTLGTYELGNCYLNGWGTAVDGAAARQYFETAANLGDLDAMEQAAKCYLDGIGGKKDKFKAAQLLRLAEKKGGPQVGNSWIWKDKYNPK